MRLVSFFGPDREKNLKHLRVAKQLLWDAMAIVTAHLLVDLAVWLLRLGIALAEDAINFLAATASKLG